MKKLRLFSPLKKFAAFALISFLVASVSASPAVQILNLESNVFETASMPFIEHVGPVEKIYDTSLAQNVPYAPIQKLMIQLEAKTGQELDFFKLWNPDGEAHITTVTPVEYSCHIRAFLPPEEMNAIAREMKIQEARFEIVSLGRGQAVVESKWEDTYFVIVKSERLLEIRRALHAAFVKNGGSPEAWDPEHFYPHITIGYTKRDLHEDDGVLKDDDHSRDNRFQIEIVP